MTRYFAPIGALLLATTLFVRGQSADERYIWIYTTIQEADSLLDKGSKTAAYDKYSEAQVALRDLQKLFPEWNQKVVNYRLGYTGERLQILAPQMPAAAPGAKLNATVNTGTGGPSATNAGANASAEQMKAMQDELNRLTSQNELLQAKLKEALSTQPSGSDPRELAKAEDQIRSLQKEKDVLQVQLEQEKSKASKGPDPALLEQERKLVADLQERLKRQTDLAIALHEENRTLKLRVEDLKYPATLPANKASEQLEIAKNLISSLQATNVALRSEQIVLATKFAELSRSFVPRAQVDQLARENEELRTKLQVAQKSGGTSAPGSLSRAATEENRRTTTEQLDEQLKIARARLEALEAKAIPYTPEELALFKAPDKNIEPATKPLKKQHEPPTGAGGLVFEAQRALDNGRLDEAEKKYQEVLRQDDRNTYTLVHLAAVQIEQNHLQDAEKNVTTALTMDPEDPLCLYLKGYLCMQQNKIEQAFDALSLSAKLLPDEGRTQYLLGKVLLQKGLPAQAETALRKAIQLMPGYREAHYSLALIYSKQKPPLKELAQWHYRKATTLGYPADPEFERQIQEAPTVSARQ